MATRTLPSSIESSELGDADAAVFEEHVDNWLRFTGAEPLKSKSVFILVMGMTGSGKSTFISRCTAHDVKIGHGLESCTAKLDIFHFQHPSTGANIYLLDSPGFDDTSRSDISTLQLITHYLSVSYSNRIHISGIIFMHRISDNRVAGTTKRNMAMFKSLVGEYNYHNVAILTTMWSPGESSVHTDREAQLSDRADFFGDALAGGARMFRHDVSTASFEDARAKSLALEVIDYLIEQARAGPVTLQVQSEMIDDRLPLNETSAGKILVGDITTMRADFSQQLKTAQVEMAEALTRQDGDAAKILYQVGVELKQKEKDLGLDASEMQATLLQLHAKEKERLEERIAEMEAQWKEDLRRKETEMKDLEKSLTHIRAEAAREAARHKVEQERKLLELERLKQQQKEREKQAAANSSSSLQAQRLDHAAVQELAANIEWLRIENAQKRDKAEEEIRAMQRREMQKIQRELEEMRRALTAKQSAVSRVRSGLDKGSLVKGLAGGVASGVVSVVMPMIMAGMLCCVM